MTNRTETRHEPPPAIERSTSNKYYDLLYIPKRGQDRKFTSVPFQSGLDFEHSPTEVVKKIQEENDWLILGVRRTIKRRYRVYEAGEQITVEEVRGKVKNFWLEYNDFRVGILTDLEAGYSNAGKFISPITKAAENNDGHLPAKVLATEDGTFYPATTNDSIVRVNGPRIRR